MKKLLDLDFFGYSRTYVATIAKEAKIAFKIKKLQDGWKYAFVANADAIKLQKLIIQRREKAKKLKTVKSQYSGSNDTDEILYETKKVECLKCHKTFVTDIDSKGIPYNRLCKNCHKANSYIHIK